MTTENKPTAPLSATDSDAINKQVTAWRREVARLQDLIAHATGASVTAPLSADIFAINFIERRAEQYLQDHADTDPGTGAVVFQYGEVGREYHSALVELADDIRSALAAADPEVCTVPPAGWRCTRAAGHDGPCAALPLSSASIESLSRASGEVRGQQAPQASVEDTVRLDYIEKHAIKGATYKGITSANIIVHEGEWHELGLRAAIDAEIAREGK